ncbi:diaminopimelate decarboxylase [Alkalibacter saccharofermentans]|uniref:Diaminopimelate decarboxylase n=1 Tax=Alkalibacter saccharofermentans DSM 14828 TaxID=1120975 RepID=A0A1M4UI95_9FIRM|nr:diaminopimelate decarboxylase [Alkalibacter saccharofermentans]SHE56378.1 diaminopimelate decarboxylase [Alkalibacter saccharofermentans DSM 14828]
MDNFIFSNHDTVELAKKYGTPLYVLSEDIIEENAETMKTAFEKCNIDYEINYAGKAFLTIAMCKIVENAGLSLDVVSGGELYTAIKAGFPMEKVCFHGSNKSIAEIEMAFDNKVGKIVADSEYELEILDRIAAKKNHKPKVMVRVSPGIEAHTHEYVQTGRIDSKFGVPLKLVDKVLSDSKKFIYLNIIGLHCHIGSQIYDEKPFLLAAETMLKLMKKIEGYGFEMKELNLGGGFGIPYLKDDSVFDVDTYVQRLVYFTKNKCDEIGLKFPKLLVEPGRFIVGTAGITLYEVGIVKEIPHTRKYISVDGGMADNPRPALYDALYHAVVANKMVFSDDEEELVTISGRCCETDTLITDVLLPKCEPGDILAVLNTGAYNYSMASNYNRLPKPAVVLLKDDKDQIIVERETYEDIILKDRLPDWYK